MNAPNNTQDAMAAFSPATGSEDSCLFCDNPRQLKPGCQKQRWMVCEKHITCKCPECGGMAHWLEGTKKGNYYLCFDSLACWWRAANPPNARLDRPETAGGKDCHE